jgi:hypothetical protein
MQYRRPGLAAFADLYRHLSLWTGVAGEAYIEAHRGAVQHCRHRGVFSAHYRVRTIFRLQRSSNRRRCPHCNPGDMRIRYRGFAGLFHGHCAHFTIQPDRVITDDHLYPGTLEVTVPGTVFFLQTGLPDRDNRLSLQLQQTAMTGHN